MQRLLGCAWGRAVSTAQDMDICHYSADRIVVVHDAGAMVDLKLCNYHARVVCELTDERQSVAV